MSTLFPPTQEEREAEYNHGSTIPPVRFWTRYTRRRWLRLVLTILIMTLVIGSFTCPDCWGNWRRMTPVHNYPGPCVTPAVQSQGSWRIVER